MAEKRGKGGFRLFKVLQLDFPETFSHLFMFLERDFLFPLVGNNVKIIRIEAKIIIVDH